MPGQIKIDDGSGNYTVLTNGGSLGSDKTITIPNTTGTMALTSDSFGKVLQVVTGTDTTEQIITSTSFVDSGLSASITPSATSSKILILIQHNFEIYRGSVDQTGKIQLLRDTTVISDITANIGAGNAGYVFNTQTISMKVLDTPSTTSAITYKTQALVGNSANSGQVKTGDDNNLETMVLMEIAG